MFGLNCCLAMDTAGLFLGDECRPLRFITVASARHRNPEFFLFFKKRKSCSSEGGPAL